MEKTDNNYQFEIEFYKDIVKDKPNYTEALIALANAYTKIGEYDKSLDIDKRLSELKPDDPIVYYNLACNYSLLERYQKAIKCLNKALSLGYKDAEHMLNDPDLDNIKESKEFKNLLEKYFKLSRP